MNTISGIYKITNTITGDFYIGSSNNVKRRWKEHKKPSTWKRYPNYLMYMDMKKYGLDKFVLEILAEVEEEHLKEVEQQFIQTLKPTYNQMNAKGLDIERYKEYHKDYEKTDKRKEYIKEYKKTDKYKEYIKEYNKSDKRKEYKKEYEKTDKRKKYKNQLCRYNGETLTLNALSLRFWKAGIPHPVIEAKKYLLQ